MKTQPKTEKQTAAAPDVIRQIELKSIIDDLEAIDLKMLGYRRRILAGAAIEAEGPFVAEFENQEPGSESPRHEGWVEFTAYGLSICPVEQSYAAIHARQAELNAAPATPPAPVAKLDPMQVRLSELSPEQEREVRDALLSRLQQQFASMGTCNIREVAQFADIEETDSECNLPAEDFITFLVMSHHARPLTPDVAAFRLEEFRENFANAARDARIFTARYPEAVKSAA
jgi:hypothetical protein